MDKAELRKKILDQRMELTPDKVQEYSTIVQEHLLKSPYWPDKGRIGLYSSTKNEVYTFRIFRLALERGLHVYFPRVEQGLRFYEVNGPEDLQRGAFAIPEPQMHCQPLPEDTQLDLIVVPGLVFSRDGYRLGYGRGFYDRILPDIGRHSVGFAYDFQICDSLPKDPWDKKLSVIMTPQHVFKFDEQH